MKRLAYIVALMILLCTALVHPAAAQIDPAQKAKADRAAKAKAPAFRPPAALPDPRTAEQRTRDRINSGTIGLAAGQLEGAPLRFASELARVLDDGDNLRVLPIVTRGVFENVYDLLFLRGVDAAIVYGDVLDHFKRDPQVGGLTRRIQYVMNLFPSEVHVFVRPEITSLADLAGKRVNFNTPGTAAAFTGPILFEKLGIKVDATFVPHPTAMEEMAKGPAYSAVVFVSSKPLGAFAKGKWPAGFKFIEVPYTEALDYYQPATLEAKDYPGLIADGGRIATVAVPTVLAVYEWPSDSDRARRINLFVTKLFERFFRLQTDPGYHPKWKDLNLAAKVPGWQRFRGVDDQLKRSEEARASGLDLTLARLQVERTAPGDRAAQELLYQQFLEWRATQAKRP